MFYFILYVTSWHSRRIYVNEISYLKAVSIVYWNIWELQPEDGSKWKAETSSYYDLLNIT